MNEETLFELALNTPPEERAGLLERKCEGKPELRARVERLLAVHFGKETRRFQAVAPTASFASVDPVLPT